MSARILATAAAFLLFHPAAPAAAQTAGPGTAPTIGQEEDVSPGGAFLRSLVVPGWGHVATGAAGRGGFYVAAQSGSLWVLWKSHARRSAARSGAAFEREIVRGRLLRQGITDPETLLTLVDDDPAVVEWEGLLDTRDQQVEDWVAMSIFLVLLGAADAYVTAHLRDYPEPLSIQVAPNAGSGGFDVGLSIRFPGRAQPGR